MAEIIKLDEHLVKDLVPAEDDDRFLIDEGLSLLADFRTIADERLRKDIRSLVADLARLHSKTIR